MTTWSSKHDDQQTIISRIEGKLNTLRTRTRPTTVYSATTPDVSSYTPQLYEEIQWFDTANNVLRNQYLRVNDNSTSSSSGTLRPLYTYPSGNVPFTVMSEINVGEAGSGATNTLNVTSQSFKHLCLYFQLRDSSAATNVNIAFRVNGLSASNYGASWQGANSTFGVGNEQVSSASWILQAPAATSARSYYLEGLLWLWDYATSTRPPRIQIRATSLWGSPYTTATTTNYNFYGIYNATVPVTSLNVVNAAGLTAGSRLVLWGV